MNRSIPLPLTGGIPQPLSDLSRCMIGAECEFTFNMSQLIPIGGSDRGQSTFKHKASSFTKLAGDPRKGVDGAVMVHALRSKSN